MKLFRNFKNRRFAKALYRNRNRNNKKPTVFIEDKIPYNNTFINIKETQLMNNTDVEVNDNRNIVHKDGDYLCFFLMLLFYYGSIIFTKLKNEFLNNLNK
tara:strand:- start:563 stop:862 length:300 start_codon:yes stop_codon:yes gene_type:complete